MTAQRWSWVTANSLLNDSQQVVMGDRQQVVIGDSQQVFRGDSQQVIMGNSQEVVANADLVYECPGVLL